MSNGELPGKMSYAWVKVSRVKTNGGIPTPKTLKYLCLCRCGLHRRRLCGCFETQKPMGEIVWVLSSYRNLPPFAVIFFIETLVFYALMQLFRKLR